MTSHGNSIVERLCEAESPHRLRDWEKSDGYYIATCRISKDDVPHLIDIAAKWSDPDWVGDDLGLAPELHIELLPITAWRSLADLKSSESVGPLICMLCELDGGDDDWAFSELPHVFGKIGSPAIGPLVQLANDADKPDSIRSIAVEGLHRVAEYDTETREEVVACLADMITNVTHNNVLFNSIVLVGLVELRAIEAAEAIERAFANDCVDVGMVGDWETVRRELGVEGLGLEMPKQPHNSIERFRRRKGVGIFSDEPLFGDGELNPDAAQAYYDRAWDLFSKSKEAEQVVDRLGDLCWFRMFLEFGLDYLGETIDEITLGGVDEFVFGYIPRKVSTEPQAAASIVFELTKFWEYVDRVYELPDAKTIIEWLKMDDMVEGLESELSNPENFGLAKSMVMSGMDAGYDMTSQEGMNEFMTAYNLSLPSRAVSPTATAVTGRQRIGRNDPCPCGSGKKFKKCCR